MRLAFAIVLATAMLALVGWAVAHSWAQAAVLGGAAAGGGGAGPETQEPPVGRYQAAVPDLVFDTASGKLVGANGQVLEPPLDPTASEVGRYSVDAYVTSVTRSVTLNVVSMPVANVELVKGYLIVDTKTGRVMRHRIYYSAPLQAGDL